MILNKKSQGLSLNMIVIAALALIVLVVIVLIFTGKLGQSGQEIDRQKEQFTGNKCEIPGAPTACREGNECRELGGSILSGKECDAGICCTV